MIWWGGGRWWLGKREEVGTNRGWLKVASNALTPAEASEGWVVYHAKEKLWVPAEGLHVHNAPLPLKHPDTDAAATGGSDPRAGHAGGSSAATPAARRLHPHAGVATPHHAASAAVAGRLPPPSWTVLPCDEGSEPGEFWAALGGRQAYDSAKVSPQSSLPQPALVPRLFACSNAPAGGPVSGPKRSLVELLDVAPASLDDDDVFILDAYAEIFVWLGRRALDSDLNHASVLAFELAAVMADVDGRPSPCPVSVVRSGLEPPSFTCLFGGAWGRDGQSAESAFERELRLLSQQQRQAKHAEEAAKTQQQQAARAEAAMMLQRAAQAAAQADVPPQAKYQSAAAEGSDEGSDEAAARAAQQQQQQAVRAEAAMLLQRAAQANLDSQAGNAAAEDEERRAGEMEPERRLIHTPGMAGHGQQPSVQRRTTPLTASLPSSHDIAASRGHPLGMPPLGRPDSLPQATRLPAPAPSDLPPQGLAQQVAARAAARPPMMPSLNTAMALRRDDTSDQLDSARRRAKVTAAALGYAPGNGMADFDDPSTARYSFEQIHTSRKDGVNPVCKELYLPDPEFEQVFGMSKKDFYSLRLWKQRELKKRFGLF